MSKESIVIEARDPQGERVARAVAEMCWQLGLGVLRVHGDKVGMATAYFETADECGFAKESVEALFGDMFQVLEHPHVSKCGLTVRIRPESV